MAMTKEEFSVIVIKINQAYRDRQPITKEGFDIWYDLLSDLNVKTLNMATSNYIRDNKYPPTIADLRSEYKRIVDHYSDMSKQLREIYDRTRGIYPDMHLKDDEETRQEAAKDAQQAWQDLIKEKPMEERIAFAKRIEEITNLYVRKVESDATRQKIPTLAEFFRGAR